MESSSRSDSCVSGRLRSWLMLVVKPFTSSPAIPTMTWRGRKPAISSASWRQTWQLSTTAEMSATVPDCMCARPWRLRPTPRTVCLPSSPTSKTSAFANSVPISSAVHDASLSLSARCRKRRQKAIRASVAGRWVLLWVAWPVPRRPAVAQVRLERFADGLERTGHAVAPGTSSLGHLGATATAALHHRRAVSDQRPGVDAALHQVIAHGYEELRLVALQSECDDAVTELGAQRAGEALQFLHVVERRCERHEPGPIHRLRGAREDARLRRPAGAGAQAPLQFTVTFLELADALR